MSTDDRVTKAQALAVAFDHAEEVDQYPQELLDCAVRALQGRLVAGPWTLSASSRGFWSHTRVDLYYRDQRPVRGREPLTSSSHRELAELRWEETSGIGPGTGYHARIYSAYGRPALRSALYERQFPPNSHWENLVQINATREHRRAWVDRETPNLLEEAKAWVDATLREAGWILL